MSVFSSNGRKLCTIIADHPQNLPFPAKTQMWMCWHRKFPWLGLEPPYMIHLVPARRANLLLAGSSIQNSIEFHRGLSRRDSLEMALFPLLLGFCLTSLTLPRDKWRLVPAVSIATASYLVWAKVYSFNTHCHQESSVGSDCPWGRNVHDFSCCPLVLCCFVCRVSSFSCLLSNRMRCKSECWTVSSNTGGRSGQPRNCCKRCQPPQNSIKTIVLKPYSWLPDFKGHWSFCLLERAADINHGEGRLRVLGTDVLLEGLQSVFFAAWCHLARNTGAAWWWCFSERESYSELCQSLALSELSLSSVRVRLKLELHEILMQEGRLSLCLPVTLPAASMGSWRDLLGDIFHRVRLSSSHLIVSPQTLALKGFLAWQVLPSLTCLCPPHPCSMGKYMKLAVTKWAKPFFCTASDSKSTWLLEAAGQNRTQGTPGTNNMHFIMCCMENRNKPAVTTKLSNNCLPQWAALHLASEDYFILVELITKSLWELYEKKQKPNSLGFET